MSAAKENILSKIRQGLEKGQLPKPYPETTAQYDTLYQEEEMLPEEVFAHAFTSLGGKFVYCANDLELLDNLHQLYDDEGWSQVLCAEPTWQRSFQNNKLDFIQPFDAGNSMADACITACECLVARTGSAMISSRQPFGRISPVYYPAHIIIAYTWQIVPDIADGMKLMQERYGDNLPSMMNLNTGPSRTADIEKTLVVGVHGPKEVYCFLVNE